MNFMSFAGRVGRHSKADTIKFYITYIVGSYAARLSGADVSKDKWVLIVLIPKALLLFLSRIELL